MGKKNLLSKIARFRESSGLLLGFWQIPAHVRVTDGPDLPRSHLLLHSRHRASRRCGCTSTTEWGKAGNVSVVGRALMWPCGPPAKTVWGLSNLSSGTPWGARELGQKAGAQALPLQPKFDPQHYIVPPPPKHCAGSNPGAPLGMAPDQN